MRCDAMVFVLLLSGEDDSLKRYAANAGQRPEKKIRHSEITAVDPFVSRLVNKAIVAGSSTTTEARGAFKEHIGKRVKGFHKGTL
ncbi:unnamed protein product [Sphagnum tenellum]